MRSLDSRSVDILKLLCESKMPVPILALSQRLGTTPRMIHYHLKMVDAWLGLRNVKLVRQPRLGISIDAAEDAIAAIWQELGSQILPPYHSTQERIYHILLDLLTQTQVMTIKQFQYQLKVSRSTILNDFHQADAWLCRYDIRLIKRQNFGCVIQGIEINIRQAILSLLIEVVGENTLLYILGNLNRMQQEMLDRKSVV